MKTEWCRHASAPTCLKITTLIPRDSKYTIPIVYQWGFLWKKKLLSSVFSWTFAAVSEFILHTFILTTPLCIIPILQVGNYSKKSKGAYLSHTEITGNSYDFTAIWTPEWLNPDDTRFCGWECGSPTSSPQKWSSSLTACSNVMDVIALGSWLDPLVLRVFSNINVSDFMLS